MPTYDYKCTNCGYKFEYFQKMTDKPLQNCPQCNGQVIKLISAGLTPIFKGSGFYETDYKNHSKSSTKSKSTSTAKSDTVKNTDSQKSNEYKKPA